MPALAVGNITTIAGTGSKGDSGDGGPAVLATVYNPIDVAVGVNVVYVADEYNSRVRAVSAGTIVTIAGTGSAGYSGDGGPATAAALNHPHSVCALRGSAAVLIADTFNNVVRAVSATGVISTIAGTGAAGYAGDGGPATSAALWWPTAVAFDASAAIYVVEYKNHVVRKVAGGVITTIAGTGAPGAAVDGPATSSPFNSPFGCAVARNGAVFVADMGNNVVRVVARGYVTTVAGSPGSRGFAGDGGPATASLLDGPTDVDVDAGFAVFVVDSNNNRVRRVGRGGNITTICGDGVQGFGGDGGAATAASLALPYGVAVDASGNVFVADTGNERVRAVGATASPGTGGEAAARAW